MKHLTQIKIEHVLEKHKYGTNAKQKENGEVFTPFNLIEKKLNEFPLSVWFDKNKTWLDPAAGLGNFHSIVLDRLSSIGNISEKHIIENQLYFIEINPESCKLIKMIFDPNNEYNMNIYCGDALTVDVCGLTKEEWNAFSKKIVFL